MTNKPILSVLVPSRERSEALKFSLDSLGLERNNLEVLVWVDDDDPELDKYHKLFDAKAHIKIFIKPRVRYYKFHEMLNFLALQATGGWLWLWNDDAYMENPDWYNIFLNAASRNKPSKEPVVLSLCAKGETDNRLFPVVSRKYFEILGHISLNTACDIWINSVAKKAKIEEQIFGMRPRHRKFGEDKKLGDLIDNTSNYIASIKAKSRYFGARSSWVRNTINMDSLKIIDWLKENNNKKWTLNYILKQANIDPEEDAPKPIEIPNVSRYDLLKWLRELDFKTGVEVGVRSGDYSKVICELNPQMQIWGVDSWTSYEGYSESIRKENFDFLEAQTREKLKAYTRQYHIIKEFSMDAVKKFKDNSLDFVYIDANHSDPYITQDISEWSKKVKSGGIVSGHDYSWDPQYDVNLAVHKYVKENNIRIWFVLGLESRMRSVVREKWRTWMWIKE